jgi:predicted PurR-regulated permease PerM
MTRFLVSSLVVLLLLTLVAAPLAAQQAAHTVAAVPFNIQVNAVLLPVVASLLRTAPGFAEQCARIADARYVRVTISPVMSSSTTSRGSARTNIRRFASGAMIAAVDMPVPLTMVEYAELLGHEFEHIVEQIERVDLDAMADARDGGASRLFDGAYETARARRVGRLIPDAVERPRMNNSTRRHSPPQ